MYYLGLVILLIAILDNAIATGSRQVDPLTRSKYFDAVRKNLDASQWTLEQQYKFSKLSDAQKKRELAKLKDYPQLLSLHETDYITSLKQRVEVVSTWASVPSDEDKALVTKILEKQLPPQEIDSQLRQLSAARPQAIRVGNIEAPTRITIPILGSAVAIPVETAFQIIHVMLLPIIFIWVGSVYVTRIRELTLIKKYGQPQLSFPHLLNLVTIRLVPSQKQTRELRSYAISIFKLANFLGVTPEKFFTGPSFSVSAPLLRTCLVILLLWPPLGVHIATSLAGFDINDTLSNGSLSYPQIFFILAYAILFTQHMLCIALELTNKLQPPIWYVE